MAESRTERAAANPPAAEASLQAFRSALGASVTISRERLQEVADDAVKRGRMTRRDAEDLVGKLVSRGREQADELSSELERTVAQLRKDLEDVRRDPAGKARREVASVRKRTVEAVDQPLASADRVRRRAGLPGFPITAYDQLSVRQIAGRLTELTRAELRRVREYERENKARKGVLRAVERELD